MTKPRSQSIPESQTSDTTVVDKITGDLENTHVWNFKLFLPEKVLIIPEGVAKKCT